MSVIINTQPLRRAELVEYEFECARFKQKVIELINSGDTEKNIAYAFNTYRIFRIRRAIIRRDIKEYDAKEQKQTELSVAINRLPEFVIAIIGEYTRDLAPARTSGRCAWLLTQIRELGYNPNASKYSFNPKEQNVPVPFCEGYTAKQLRPIYNNSSTISTIRAQSASMIRDIRFHMFELTYNPGTHQNREAELTKAWAFLMNLKEYNARITAPKVRKSAKK